MLLAASVMLFVLMMMPAGCVATAECDATVPCEEGAVCYDYVCRSTCETASECRDTEVCAPCLQDDAEGTVDHCFEQNDFVCLPTEQE